jgi:hypothetical protein
MHIADEDSCLASNRHCARAFLHRRKKGITMFWRQAFDLGSSLWANGLALSQTAMASKAVIGHRGRTIDAAIRSPLLGDYGELGRMVPEKVVAFGAAGAILSEDWLAIQADFLAQGRDIGLLLLGGWPPSTSLLARVSDRGADIAVKMSRAGGRALGPVHKTATGNQRRLRRRG